MHKKFLIFISIIAISLLTGCAGSIYPYAIKPHVVSGIHYIDTQIPEHMEIDLLVLGNNYERLPPRYNSDIGTCSVGIEFVTLFRKGDSNGTPGYGGNTCSLNL